MKCILWLCLSCWVAVSDSLTFSTPVRTTTVRDHVCSPAVTHVRINGPVVMPSVDCNAEESTPSTSRPWWSAILSRVPDRGALADLGHSRRIG